MGLDVSSGVVNAGGGIAAGNQTTIPVDTVDATLHFDVGIVLDNTGATVGTVQSVTATLITLLANIGLADDELLFKRQPPSLSLEMDLLQEQRHGILPRCGSRNLRSTDPATQAATVGKETTKRTKPKTPTSVQQREHTLPSITGTEVDTIGVHEDFDTSTDTISLKFSMAADENPKILVKGLFIKRQTVVGSS